MERLRRLVRAWAMRILLTPLYMLLGAAGAFGGVNVDLRKVAVYIRWSTDDQSEGTTLDTQRDACLHFAHSQGFGAIPPERIFIDDGYSGSSLERPAMTALRELVRKGEVTCVVVYTIDRLSRNIVDAVNLVLREWEGVCHLKCVRQPIDTTTDLGRMIFGILAMFADFERSQITARTFSGRVRRAAQGRNPGGRLNLGYRQGDNPGDILVDEEQKELVLRIFRLYADGNGDRTIAALLNAEGVTSPRGKQWDKSTIGQMLVNKRYIGTWTFGETRKNDRRGKAGDQPLRVVSETPLAAAERPDLAIVPLDLWERCQVIRRKMVDTLKKTSGRAVGSDHLLSGLVRCKCGGAMRIAMDGRSRKGEKRYKNPFYYFRCAQRENKGESVCDCGTIAEKDLNEFVARVVKGLGEDAMKQRLVAVTVRTSEEKVRQAQAKLATANATRQVLADDLSRIRGDYRSGKLDVDTFNEMRQDIEREQVAEHLKIAGAEAELVTNSDGLTADRSVLALADQAGLWDELTIAQRKSLLRDLIESLTIYRKKQSTEPVQIALRILGIPDWAMEEAFSLQTDF